MRILRYFGVGEIGRYKANINLQFEVSQSYHSNGRQGRHDREDKGNHIEEEEIIHDCKEATQDIIEGILANKIDCNKSSSRCLITNRQTGLNIVLGFRTDPDIPTNITATVITTARYGDKFRNQGGSYEIFI